MYILKNKPNILLVFLLFIKLLAISVYLLIYQPLVYFYNYESGQKK